MLLTRNTLDAEFLVDSVLAPDFFRDRLVAGFLAARLFVVETPQGVGFCGVIVFLDILDSLCTSLMGVLLKSAPHMLSRRITVNRFGRRENPL